MSPAATDVREKVGEERQERLDVFYRPELDCLRFFAFFAVFVHHYLPDTAELWILKGAPRALAPYFASAVQAGGLGVDLFFVLSSYLITELLLREQATYGSFNIKSFYIRRILRIWPLYFGFLLLISFFPAYRLPSAYLAAFLLLAGNWIIAFQGYPRSPAALLWSVSIEEQFYLTWPLLIRLTGVHRLKQACFVLLSGTMIVRLFLIMKGVPHPGIWCNTLARLDPIVLGALIAALLDHRVPRFAIRTRLLFVAAGCVALVSATHLLDYSGPKSLFFYSITALSCCAILLGVLGLQIGESPVAKALTYLGRISYGLYVFHVLTIELFARRLPFARFPLLLLINIGIAALSYHVYEKPFLRLKGRFGVIKRRPADILPDAAQAVSL